MNKKLQQIRIKRKRIRLLISPYFQKLIIEGSSVSVQLFSKYIRNNILFIPSLAMSNSFYKRIRHWLMSVPYGFFTELKTEGVGLKFLRYYASPQLLSLTLGFSHTILFRVPKKVIFRCLKYKLLLFSLILKNYVILLTYT
jgi:hypothetical protein